MAGFQPDVPPCADQALQFFFQRGIRRLVEQDQQINVGVREKLPASIAADRHQRKARRQIVRLPHVAQQLIDQRAVFMQ